MNVGFGDNIIIEFPVDGNGRRSFAVADCYKGKKTKDYLDALVPNAPDRQPLKFICASHPHYDHICVIPYRMRDPTCCPEEFWDSGFRHSLATYKNCWKRFSPKISACCGSLRGWSGISERFVSPPFHRRSTCAIVTPLTASI